MKDTLAIFGGKPVRANPLYYGKQSIDQNDINAVIKVMESDFLTCGPAVKNMEKKLKTTVEAPYAVSVTNGTAALHTAVFAFDIHQGDEIITTPMTFAATANAILYHRGIPVFADICPDTYNISAESIQSNITSKTKGVIVVDYTGQPADYEEIIKICKENNLWLIEDAAHSIGSKYKGKSVGSFADATTFSFHPVKTVTSGEGGAITCKDKQIYEKMALFRTHGITRDMDQMIHPTDDPWYYEQVYLGYNNRLTDIQAALLSSQLDKLNFFSKQRKKIVKKYQESFSKLDTIVLQRELEDADTTPHLFIIQLKLENLHATRREIYDALVAENIYCNVHYIPVYYHPYYEKLGYKRGLCPNAEWLYERILSIPLYPSMSDQDVDDVIHAIRKVLDYYKK